MKRFPLLILAILFTPLLARAQIVLSAASTDCSVANSCLSIPISNNQGAATFAIIANASGNTIQFETTVDPQLLVWVSLNVTPSNGSTAITSTATTTPAAWQANVAGYHRIRIRLSTLIAGTTTVSLTGSFASARAGSGGGGAAGVASVNGLTGTLTLAAGTNITLTPSGNTITVAASGAGGCTPPGSTGRLLYDTGAACGDITQLSYSGSTITGTSGTLDLTGMTLVKLRVSAGCATTANGDFCYDSTGNKWLLWQNGANKNLIAASNLGSAGQPCMSNADGSCTFADPVVSQPTPSLLNATVTEAAGNWNDAIINWGGGVLGAMATYGTSPGAVLTPGVNAFITNSPTVTANAGTGQFNVTCTAATCPVNVSQFGGNAVATGTGTAGVGIPRVTISNDSSLAANQSVNVSQINATTVLTGAGATGTGSPRETVAQDTNTIAGSAPGTAGTASSSVVTVQGVAGMTKLLVTPHSVALPGNQSVNESQINGHTTAECGLNGCNAVGGATADGSAATTDPIPVAGKGAAGVNRVPVVCDNSAPFSLASTTALKIIALISGKNIYICSINIVVAGANNVALVDGTKVTTDCDTATHGLAGGTTAATGWNFAANGGLTQGSGIGVLTNTVTVSHDVCLFASASTQVSGVVSWTDF